MRAMQEPKRAQLFAVEAVHQELVLGNRGPLESLVQPRHRPGVGVDEANDPPDVVQERRAVLLAVVGMQSLSDQPCAIDLHRARSCPAAAPRTRVWASVTPGRAHPKKEPPWRRRTPLPWRRDRASANRLRREHPA